MSRYNKAVILFGFMKRRYMIQACGENGLPRPKQTRTMPSFLHVGSFLCHFCLFQFQRVLCEKGRRVGGLGRGAGGGHAIQVLSRTPPGSIESMFTMLFRVTPITLLLQKEIKDMKTLGQSKYADHLTPQSIYSEKKLT